MPLHVITKEHATHLSKVIRFTHPDGRGHYLKKEYINAYGGYLEGQISPYLFDVRNDILMNDSTVNQDWAAKLRTACFLEQLPDPIGESVLQERAYDSEGNIIFTFSRTPIGTNEQGRRQYIGTYRDSYGLPVDMWRDASYTFGTLVRLTEDRWGNDSIMEYLDGSGKIKPNYEGTHMLRYICNERGLVLQRGTCDSFGNWTLSKWGICGEISAYDDKDNLFYEIFFDHEGKAMAMTDLMENFRVGLERINVEYDNYGRKIRQWYTKADGITPMQNKYGCHRGEIEYDDKGNVLSWACFDVDGHLTPEDDSGAAMGKNKYDDRGQMIERAYFGADGCPYNCYGQYCRGCSKYDDSGVLIEQEHYYVTDDGEEIIIGQQILTDSIEMIKYYDGSSIITAYDERHRITSETTYDADSIITEKHIYEYIDEPGKLTIKYASFDGHGRPLAYEDGGIYRCISTRDSIAHTQWMRQYNTDDFLVKSYIHLCDEGFNKPLSEYSANAFGIPCRNGKNGVFDYLADVYYTPKDEFGTFIGRDEFGEPDYIDGGGTPRRPYYYAKFNNVYPLCLDENNRPIDGNECNRLPKVISIEVTDSAAYDLGLKDNDVVIVYGGYSADPDSVMSEDDTYNKWNIHNIIESTTERRMVVFRVNPNTLEYGLVDIGSLQGTPKQLGFHGHVRFLTQRQLNRIISVVDTTNIVGATHDCLNRRDAAYTGPYEVVVDESNMLSSDHILVYPRQVTDASFVLSIDVPDINLRWTLDIGSSFHRVLVLHDKRKASTDTPPWPAITYCFTRDMQTIEELTITDQRIGVTVRKANVNRQIYERLKKLIKQHDKELRKSRRKSSKRGTTLTQ